MSAFTTARLRTWHPATRTERTWKTQRTPFSGDPTALIAFARRMLPKLQPTIARLLYGSGPLVFEVCFGTDRKGTQWGVEFELDAACFQRFLNRVLQQPNALAIGLAVMAVADDPGTGGEELPVPRVSSHALADMAATTAAIN